jgi:uncharacterized protein (TIGR02145 family)
VDIVIKIFRFLFILIVLLLMDSSCSKKPELPAVMTAEMTEITQTYATSGGTVMDDGGADVMDSGICWSTAENPTISDSMASCCPGIGTFIIRLTQLFPDTKYYARAYATNSSGTGYGNQVSFITDKVALAGVLTTNVSEICLTSASSGGFIFDDGGGPVTAKGVCWSTLQDPTVLDSKTNDEFDDYPPEGYLSRLTGLIPGTKYYVRAYVTNSAGTTYGYQVRFSTMSNSLPAFNPDLSYGTVSDIDGNIYRTIQIGTQTWMAENLKATRFNDGSPIPLITDDTEWDKRSAPAMCWYVNDPGNYEDLFGGYYNFYAVKTKKLCPVGWHTPDKVEWSLLISNSGSDYIAGGKLKEPGFMHWLTPNSGATNESGFTGMPGGYRKNGFRQIGESANWWSTSSSSHWPDYHSDSYILDYRNSKLYLSIIPFYTDGLNVRCVKD